MMMVVGARTGVGKAGNEGRPKTIESSTRKQTVAMVG